MADARLAPWPDLDELEANERKGLMINTPALLTLIARCRAAEERADNAEGQVAAVRALREQLHGAISSAMGFAQSEGRELEMVRLEHALNAAVAPRAEATPEEGDQSGDDTLRTYGAHPSSLVREATPDVAVREYVVNHSTDADGNLAPAEAATSRDTATSEREIVRIENATFHCCHEPAHASVAECLRASGMGYTLTEDPTVGAIETAAGASTPAVDPATTAQKEASDEAR